MVCISAQRKQQMSVDTHRESSRCITAWPTRATEATCSPEMFSHCVRSCRKCFSRAGTCPPAVPAYVCNVSGTWKAKPLRLH